jgi:hypothetical protein
MEKTTIRKTAKYYRDILNGDNIYASVRILPEVIRKYGHQRWKDKDAPYEISVRDYTEFEWNHQIERFSFGKSGKVIVDIYWQGDSTDGTTDEYASDLINGKVIRGEYEWLGNRTYCRHGDLRISREEFANAVKAVAKYLAPEEVKKRKEEERKRALTQQVFDLVSEQVGSKDESYWNGRYGVQKLLEKEPELLDKTFEELKPIVLKVFRNNNKTDYTLRGGWWHGEKKYNLAY